MLRLAQFRPRLLRAKHLHGPHHYTNPISHGLELAYGTQNEDLGRNCHEPWMDVSLYFHSIMTFR